jgi:hypothetical protein
MEHARDLQFPIGVDFPPEQLQASIDPAHSVRPSLQFHDPGGDLSNLVESA